MIAMNQFAGVLTNATERLPRAEHAGNGTPVVVYNPLNIAREDVVEADDPVAAGGSQRRACDRSGREGGAGAGGRRQGAVRGEGAFCGLCGLRRGACSEAAHPRLKVNVRAGGRGGAPANNAATSLENARYRVTLDNNGDVSSIFDKTAEQGVAVRADSPGDLQRPAEAMAGMEHGFRPGTGCAARLCRRPAKIRIKENGPVRVALEVDRATTEGSKFVQTVSLSAGDAGNRVEFGNVDRLEDARLATLKATFPLSASNNETPPTTGTSARSSGRNAYERQFEVASHHWIDLTDKSGSFGTTILTDEERFRQTDDNTFG